MKEVQNKEPGVSPSENTQVERGGGSRSQSRLSRFIQVLKSPLTHKLVAVVFVAILLIEFIILFPSYLRKENEILQNLVHSAEQVAQTSFYALSNPDDFLIYSLAILQSPVVEGVKIISKQGEILVESGEPIIGVEEKLKSEKSIRSKDGNRHHYKLPSEMTPIPHDIYLRLNSSNVSVELNDYLLRVTWLVILVTIVLTVATLIGAGIVVLRPLIGLRDALGEGETFNWDENRSRQLRRKDELGDVYRATAQLLGRLTESQKNLEARVEERTTMLAANREELAEKERLLRSIFETAAIGIVLHSADGKTRTMVNKAFCEMVGYSQEHLLKSTFDDLTHPDDMSKSLERRNELESGQIDQFTIEKRYLHKNGNIIWGSINTTVLRNELGDIANYVSFVRDVTLQKEAESELESKTAMLELTLENMDQGITMVDENLQYTAYNKKFIEMFDFPSVMFQAGITIQDIQKFCIKRGDYGPEFAEMRLAEAKKFEPHVVERRTRDGKVYELRGNPVEGGGMVTTYTDITEQKQSEEILRKGKEDAEALAKAKSDFVAVVSHEIRTPMNGVLGMARLLSDTKLNSEQRDSVNIIVESGNALLRIIDDLLDISKIDAEKLDLEYAPFVPADVVAQSIALLSSRSQERKLSLSYNVAPDVPDVLVGDAHRLRQVFLNLVGNSIKFTDEGTVSVDVSVQSKSESNVVLVFAIKDTGQGISDEDQEKLFSDYAQASVEVARKHGGTGLGLSVCRRIIERMGGKIWVASELGKGSTFSFTAVFAIGSSSDISDADNLPELTSSRHQNEIYKFRPLRILQVEDNETNREVAEKILVRAGHQVTNAVNGMDGLAAVKTGQFDIVLMDRHMPVMDGVTATKKIRSLSEPLASIPILGITAGATQIELQECRDSGMDEVLKKPVYSKELCEMVLRLTSDEPEIQSSYELPVLVVDDTKINRVVAQSQLKKLGAMCDLAVSGAEAIEMFQNKTYGIVFTDISMPKMDGIELAKQLKKLNNNKKTPLIAMTGHRSKSDHDQYLQSGFDGVLTKPVSLEKLSAILGNWLTTSDSNTVGASNDSSNGEPAIDLQELTRIYGEDDEEELFEIISMFVDQFPPLLDTLDAAIANKDNQAIRDAAHAAKGASASTGATQLQELLFSLEKKALSAEWDFINQQIEKIQSEFSRVKIFKENH